MYLPTAVQTKAAFLRLSARVLLCLSSINDLHEVSSTLSIFSSFRVKREFKTLELQSQCRHLLDFLVPTSIFFLVIMTTRNSPAIFKAIYVRYFLKSLQGANFFIVVLLETTLSLSALICLRFAKQFSKKYGILSTWQTS